MSSINLDGPLWKSATPNRPRARTVSRWVLKVWTAVEKETNRPC